MAKTPIVSWIITLAYVPVNRERQAIRRWAAWPFNIVAATINVRRERFVMLAFAVPFVRRVASASAINCACRACVNRRVTATPAVPISNSVRTTFAHRRFAVVPTRIVCTTRIVSPIHMDVPNVEIRAKDAFCAVAMPNAQQEITMHCVRVRPDSSVTHKQVVVASNVKRTRNVHRTSSAREIFVNWHVKSEKCAVRRHCVQRKIIVPCAIVNQVSAATHIPNVRPWTIAATHLVALEPFARITKERSTALAATDMSETRTMRAVDWHSNVELTQIVRRVPNVLNIPMDRNVETFAKDISVDRMPTVRRSIMWHSAIADPDMEVKRPISMLDVDHYLFHALCHRIVPQIRTATVAFVSRLARSIRSVDWKKSVRAVNV